MSFWVNEEKSAVAGTTTMKVIVDGTLAQELTTVKARNAVLQYARSSGFPARGLGGVPSPYPVGEDERDDEADLVMGRKPIKFWRAEYFVSSGIGA